MFAVSTFSDEAAPQPLTDETRDTANSKSDRKENLARDLFAFRSRAKLGLSAPMRPSSASSLSCPRALHHPPAEPALHSGSAFHDDVFEPFCDYTADSVGKRKERLTGMR